MTPCNTRRDYTIDLSTPEAIQKACRNFIGGDRVPDPTPLIRAGLSATDAMILQCVIGAVAGKGAIAATHYPDFFLCINDYIVKGTGFSVPTVSRAIKSFMAYGLIDVVYLGSPPTRYIRPNMDVIMAVRDTETLPEKEKRGAIRGGKTSTKVPKNDKRDPVQVNQDDQFKLINLINSSSSSRLTSLIRASDINHCPAAEGGTDSVCPSVSGEGGPNQGLSSPQTRGVTIKDKEEGLPSIKDSGAPETEKVKGGRSPVKNPRRAPGYTQTKMNVCPEKGPPPSEYAFKAADTLRDILADKDVLYRRKYPRESWAREIDCLLRDLMDHYSIDLRDAKKKINAMLGFLDESYGRNYCPEPNSASSFREKFARIEAAYRKAERKRLGLRDDQELPEPKKTTKKSVNGV